MAYIGKSIESGTFSVLDTSGNTYNGSNTAFNLGTQVGSVAQLLVSHDGVIQKPGTDYTLSSGGAAITFTTAPASGASIFIVEISGAVGGPLDSDLNGTELILDADGDTSITADTDDQIDIKVAGADDFQFTANTFTAQSGSSIVVPDGGLTFGSTAISSTAAELNILDGVTATAAEINLIDGGTSRGTTAIADGDGVLINDAGTMRQTTVETLKTYIGGANHVLVGSSASDSATSSVNFDNVFTTTYSKYLILATRLTSSSNNENIYIQMRTGGSNKTSSNYNYILTGNKSNTTGTSNINTGYNNQTQMMVTRGLENTDAQGGARLTLNVFDPAVTGYTTGIHGVTSFRKGTSGDYEAYTFGGQRETTGEAHDGIRIYISSGNLNNHRIYIYGVKDS